MEDFTQCDHPVRVSGMCAVCGRALDDNDDVGRASPSSLSRDDGVQQQLHDMSGIQISSAEAARLDSESTRRLLSQRKLALIVDLDQTIIHATVDPTVGEWMKDASNPNYAALADVGKFLLGADGKEVLVHDNHEDKNVAQGSAAIQDGCWYYVKPRPGLQNFLKRLGEKYEMHVYTMGTRTYAESVCRLVDPQGTIFGARIISRDENGSLLQKSLKKLFPMDTSMVVIIDDRADVWQWSPHLVRVQPFDFFVGIGDINASFLPTLPSGPTPTPEATAAASSASIADGDAVEEIGQKDKSNGVGNDSKAMSNSSQSGDDGAAAAEAKAKAEDDAAKSVAEESQKSTVTEQIDARPLAKMQEALEGNGKSSEKARQAAAVLKEDDRELDKLQDILEDVHTRWYNEYTTRGQPDDDKPTTRTIISQLKTAVLHGCTIVFSSIAPLHQDPTTTDLWRLASEFGAHCKRAIDATVTHVVTAKQGTEKVIQGHRRGVHVVWFTWLQESCAHWSRQSEKPFELPRPSSSTSTVTSGQKRDDDVDAAAADDADARDADGLSDTASEGDRALIPVPGEEDDQGFGEMNWDEANDEVDAVLQGISESDFDDDDGDEDDGDDDDEDDYGKDKDGDSETDAERLGTRNGMKRSRSTRSDKSDVSTDGETQQRSIISADEKTLSPLSKRRRMAELRAGHSKLKNDITRDSSQAPSSSAGGGGSDAALGAQPRGQDDDLSSNRQGMIVNSQTRDTDATEDEGDQADFLQSLEDELELQLGADESGEATTS